MPPLAYIAANAEGGREYAPNCEDRKNPKHYLFITVMVDNYYEYVKTAGYQKRNSVILF